MALAYTRSMHGRPQPERPLAHAQSSLPGRRARGLRQHGKRPERSAGRGALLVDLLVALGAAAQLQRHVPLALRRLHLHHLPAPGAARSSGPASVLSAVCSKVEVAGATRAVQQSRGSWCRQSRDVRCACNAVLGNTMVWLWLRLSAAACTARSTWQVSGPVASCGSSGAPRSRRSTGQ